MSISIWSWCLSHMGFSHAKLHYPMFSSVIVICKKQFHIRERTVENLTLLVPLTAFIKKFYQVSILWSSIREVWQPKSSRYIGHGEWPWFQVNIDPQSFMEYLFIRFDPLSFCSSILIQYKTNWIPARLNKSFISLVPNGVLCPSWGPLQLSPILFNRPSELSKTRPEGMY